MIRPIALITGASAGIGYELARVFAERGHDLVVTARREDRLAGLAAELGPICRVDVVAADLARRKGVQRLLSALDELGRPVDVLVNNAGVAAHGRFRDLDSARVLDIVQVNVRALTLITHALLPGMLERGRGRILNISSVTGFQPVPGMALYGASKAFVLTFTESLAEELRGSGVTATALCPGLTRTGMVAELPSAELMGAFMASPRDVAMAGYRACMAGETVRVPGLLNQALLGWTQAQPRWLVRTLSGLAARAAGERRD
jgi:uncharacterized protein